MIVREEATSKQIELVKKAVQDGIIVYVQWCGKRLLLSYSEGQYYIDGAPRNPDTVGYLISVYSVENPADWLEDIAYLEEKYEVV